MRWSEIAATKNKKPEDRLIFRLLDKLESVPRRMLARFGTAHYQLASQELLVVQFLYCSFGFLDGLHLNESKTFGPLVVTVTDYLCILDMADTVKQLEQVALGRIK